MHLSVCSHPLYTSVRTCCFRAKSICLLLVLPLLSVTRMPGVGPMSPRLDTGRLLSSNISVRHDNLLLTHPGPTCFHSSCTILVASMWIVMHPPTSIAGHLAHHGCNYSKVGITCPVVSPFSLLQQEDFTLITEHASSPHDQLCYFSFLLRLRSFR